MMSAAVAGQTMTGAPALTREGAQRQQAVERSTPRERAPHLPALTGLRFLAALWVVLLHLSGARPGLLPGGLVGAVIDRGYLGVDLFFVLSGFVLAIAGLRSDGGLRRSRCAFWLARFARIYPAYALALLLSLPFLLRDWAYLPHHWITALSTLTLTQAWMPYDARLWNAPGWSLSAEALFYLAFPLLAPRLGRLDRGALLRTGGLLWALGLALAALYVSYRAADIPFYVNPLLRLPEFLVGVCAGRLFMLDRAGRRTGRTTSRLAILAGALALALALALPASWNWTLDHGLLAPLFAAALYGLAWQQGPLARILSAPRLVLLGEASYSLYLLHWPVLRGLAAYLHQPEIGPAGPGAGALTFGVVGVLLAMALSLLALRYVERPARALILGSATWGYPGPASSRAAACTTGSACAAPCRSSSARSASA